MKFSSRTALKPAASSSCRTKIKDFKVESKQKILTGLDRPYGLAFWKDYLYVAEATSLKRYKYDSKGLKVESKGEEIVSLKPFGKGHWTRTVLFDPKGEKMYLTVGSASNVDAGEDAMRAAIHRFNPDGTAPEIVASGVRNVIGLRWYPGTETLWAAVQERDGLGDDLVPDYFTAIHFGGFYGWPYAYLGPHEDPRRKGERPDLVAKTLVPDVWLGAHVAVLDALFYTGNQFPIEYQGRGVSGIPRIMESFPTGRLLRQFHTLQGRQARRGPKRFSDWLPSGPGET